MHPPLCPRRGRTWEAEDLLDNFGAEVNRADPFGRYAALHWAALMGQVRPVAPAGPVFSSAVRGGGGVGGASEQRVYSRDMGRGNSREGGPVFSSAVYPFVHSFVLSFIHLFIRLFCFCSFVFFVSVHSFVLFRQEETLSLLLDRGADIEQQTRSRPCCTNPDAARGLSDPGWLTPRPALHQIHPTRRFAVCNTYVPQVQPHRAALRRRAGHAPCPRAPAPPRPLTGSAPRRAARPLSRSGPDD